MGSVFRRTGARKWSYKYKGADGRFHTKTGFTDKEATAKLCRDTEKKEARRRVGLVDVADDEVLRPIAEHINEYIGYIEAREVTEDQSKRLKSRIKAVVSGCRFALLTDINARQVAGYLADRRSNGALTCRTSNAYLAAIKGFCGRLVKWHRLTRNPIDELDPVPLDHSEIRQRRAASDDEVAWLLKTTKTLGTLHRLSGESRYWLYQIALWTGLRAEELSTVEKSGCCLTGDTPYIHPGKTKNRKPVNQPILPEQSCVIAGWIKHLPDGPLWPGRWWRRAADMIHADLDAARDQWIKDAPESEKQVRQDSDFLAFKNRENLFLDFHALRHTYITNLVRAGLHPKVVQILARHSDMRLTMEFYTHLPPGDLYAAIRTAFGARG
jgi:integrase/recombinase XerD